MVVKFIQWARECEYNYMYICSIKMYFINLVNNPLQCLYTINCINYTTTFYFITLIQLVVGGGGFFQLFLGSFKSKKSSNRRS